MLLSFKEFIKEQNDTTTSAVSGLGFNSGNPAVNSDRVANYTAQNTADSDNKNNILGMHYTDHAKRHNVVGFDAFDPKKQGINKVKETYKGKVQK
jgi:hypothetical protein